VSAAEHFGFAEKDIDTLFNDTISLFEGNDINFVNLECALTEADSPIEKFGPPLKACGEVAEVLKTIGVNVCGLSNNHIFDFGKKGVEDTIKHLSRCAIEYTGFGNHYMDSRKNWIREKDDERIAVIAVCEHEYSYALDDRMGSRPWDEFDTIDDIREAKKEADRVIVIYHGGKEHCKYPSPRLIKACRAMVKNGADVVLCQHSHCIGCYENFEGGHILYGQGNFQN
jgi:poly-gamma-glutamate synthesis protein (capsule biosynthesis protein)